MIIKSLLLTHPSSQEEHATVVQDIKDSWHLGKVEESTRRGGRGGEAVEGRRRGGSREQWFQDILEI